MSNVVSIFKNKTIEVAVRPPVDTNSLLLMIVEWAEAQGINCYDNPTFEVRVGDLAAQLQIMAMDIRETA